MLAAAAILAAPAAPSFAAACADRGGVTVVVDFHQLGGGLHQVCDGDGGGKTAATIFTDNGFPLTFVQRFPGAVCRVSGKPAEEPCVDMPPETAYWVLYWADGKGSTWTYSSLGATSLRIPAGGSVAFSWSQGGRTNPGVGPTVHPDEPTPTPQSQQTQESAGAGGGGTGGGSRPGKRETRKPAPTPTRAATPTPSATAPTASATPRPSRTPRKPPRSRGSTPSATPVATPTEAPSTAVAAPSASPAAAEPVSQTAADADSGGGVPGWLPPVLIAVLAAVAGAVARARRRSA